jgi:hypothetical protein
LRTDSVKYLDEINFGFQDADPWNFFQDDAGTYWDSLTILGLKIASDTASLKWTLKDLPSDYGYAIKLKRQNSVWKITYMQGFDTSCCW